MLRRPDREGGRYIPLAVRSWLRYPLAYARAFSTTRLLMQTVLIVPVSNRIWKRCPYCVRACGGEGPWAYNCGAWIHKNLSRNTLMKRGHFTRCIALLFLFSLT